MGKNNLWSETAQEIMDSISEAIDSRDFSGLSQNISTTLNNATIKINDATRDFVNNNFGKNGSSKNGTQDTYYDEEKNAYVNKTSPIDNVKGEIDDFVNQHIRKNKSSQNINNNIIQDNRTNKPAIYAKKVPGRFKANVMSGLGITTGIVSVAPVTMGILQIATMSLTSYSIAGIFTSSMLIGVPFAIMGAFFSKGNSIRKINNRFERYKECIGDDRFIDLKYLSKKAGVSFGKIKKDIKYMIENKYFVNAKYDRNENVLILDDETYQDYIEKKEEFYSKNNSYSSDNYSEDDNNQNSEDKSRETETDYGEEFDENVPIKVRELVRDGRDYVRKIHNANNSISRGEVKVKLDKLESIMTAIFDRVKKQPESADDLRKLMKYYLPTTIKLLDVYIEMDSQSSYNAGNVEKTKKEIEDTLDVINEAFTKLFDSLFEDTAWDVSSDIAAMKTMMAQDGLSVTNDFNKE